MASLQFKRGLLANMPQSIQDGTLYVTTDEHAMYLDYGNQRLRLGDFVPVDTVQDLPASGHAYETAVYYVRQGNILARWDSTNNRWVQINKAGVVGITTNGTGNIISDVAIATSDDGQLRLVVTKTTVASAQDLADLEARVTTLEGDMDDVQDYITVLQGDASTSGSLAKLAADIQSSILGNEVTYTDLKRVGDKLRALDSSLATLQSDVSSLQSDVSDLQSDVSDNTSAIATLNGNANTPGSVAAAVAAEASARQSADTALQGRVTTLETDVGQLQGDVADNTDAIAVLNGPATQSGSVAKQVADAVARIVDDAPAAYDTLKEISDWISTHADSAATMNSQIVTLQGDVSTL